MELFRPVGIKELELIRELEFKAFPPRLAIQPIFYPVLNEDYAVQIAKEWNTRDAASGFVGYVTRFEVDDDYVSKFERKIVGSRVHEELWVPSEELEEFNSHIIGKIEVTQAFHSLEYLKPFGLVSGSEAENNLSNLSWTFDDKVECHEHCSACMATLCSDHYNPNGFEWQSAFRAVHPEGYSLHLCPPCFECLRDAYQLSVT